MSLINTEVKPFKATAYHNGEFVDVSSDDMKGQWSIVFFYPADFTFVCPTELGDLADHYAELQKMGVEVYSVSTDTHFTHKAWHASSDTIGKIDYFMIGAPTGEISASFAVLRDGQGRAARGAFVLDPNLDGRFDLQVLRHARNTQCGAGSLPSDSASDRGHRACC